MTQFKLWNDPRGNFKRVLGGSSRFDHMKPISLVGRQGERKCRKWKKKLFCHHSAICLLQLNPSIRFLGSDQDLSITILWFVSNEKGKARDRCCMNKKRKYIFQVLFVSNTFPVLQKVKQLLHLYFYPSFKISIFPSNFLIFVSSNQR